MAAGTPYPRPESSVSGHPGPPIQAGQCRTAIPFYFLLVFSGKQVEKPKEADGKQKLCLWMGMQKNLFRYLAQAPKLGASQLK